MVFPHFVVFIRRIQSEFIHTNGSGGKSVIIMELLYLDGSRDFLFPPFFARLIRLEEVSEDAVGLRSIQESFLPLIS